MVMENAWEAQLNAARRGRLLAPSLDHEQRNTLARQRKRQRGAAVHERHRRGRAELREFPGLLEFGIIFFVRRDR